MKPTDDDAKRFAERAEALLKAERAYRTEFALAYPIGMTVRHKASGRMFAVIGHYPEAAYLMLAAPGERGSKVSRPYVVVTDLEPAEAVVVTDLEPAEAPVAAGGF